MEQIECNKIGEAWVAASKFILENGNDIKDGDVDLKEVCNLTIKVNDPLQQDILLEKFADQKMIDWMINNFMLQKEIEGWGYSYGQRFFSFNGRNQIEWVIKNLQKKRESKSATITALMPGADDKHVPCICAIDFKIRNNKLNTTAFFRSQDIGKKIYADMISLAKIASLVADSVKAGVGFLVLHIASAHIYESDMEKIKSLVV